MNHQDLKVGFVCFKNLTPLDLVGPFEVLSRVFQKTFIVGESKEPLSSPKGLKILPDYDLKEAPEFDILVVPGGNGQTAAMENEELISFIKKRYEKCLFTAGICTGTLLLARAGILKGKEATTHWLARYELEKFDARYSNKRVVWSDDKIITGAGVSAGIDLALMLVDRIFGESKAREVQLSIEYDPAPPYDGGRPEKTSTEIVEKLISESRFREGWLKRKDH